MISRGRGARRYYPWQPHGTNQLCRLACWMHLSRCYSWRGRAAAAVGKAVAALGAAGARTLLVPNLPDLGITLAVQAVGPAAAAQARRQSLAYDDALARVLDRVEARHPGVAILRLDVQALAERVLADPGAAGFRDVINPCQGRLSCEGALFWDLIHPSAHAHARLAAAASTLIETSFLRKNAGQSE